MEEFRDRMHRLRLEQGMTLEEVGQIVGVGKSTVRKWEQGIIVNMRIDKIKSLADALGVSPEYLLGWENSGEQEAPALSKDEKELIRSYRSLSPKMRKIAYDVVNGLSGKGD